MYSIKDKIRCPIYIPDVFLKLGNAFYEKINDFFSYKIFYLHPNQKNIKEIKDIIEFRKCPNFKHKLYYADCFNPIDNYKVTLIRICHQCNQMFVLSGRYSTKIKYQNAFEFLYKQNNKMKEVKK